MEVKDYCHPEYTLDHEVRCHAKFDYYSFGLVLLEIGTWRFLGRMTNGKEGLVLEDFYNCVFQMYILYLDYCVGEMYREGVMRCLQGGIGFDMDLRNGRGNASKLCHIN